MLKIVNEYFLTIWQKIYKMVQSALAWRLNFAEIWERTQIFWEETLPVSGILCRNFLERAGYVIRPRGLGILGTLEVRDESLQQCVVNYKVQAVNWWGLIVLFIFSNYIYRRIHLHSRKLLLFLYLNQGSAHPDTAGFEHLSNQSFLKRFPVFRAQRPWPKPDYRDWSLEMMNKRHEGFLKFRRRRVLVMPIQAPSLQDWFPPPYHFSEYKDAFLEIGLDAGYPDSRYSLAQKGQESTISVRILVPVFFVQDDEVIHGYSCIFINRFRIFPGLVERFRKNDCATWNVGSGGVRLSVGNHRRELLAELSFSPRERFKKSHVLPDILFSPRIRIIPEIRSLDMKVIQQRLEFPVNRITVVDMLSKSSLRFFDWLNAQSGLCFDPIEAPSFLLSYLDVITESEHAIDLRRFQYRKETAIAASVPVFEF